jgi:hypothetical protein
MEKQQFIALSLAGQVLKSATLIESPAHHSTSFPRPSTTSSKSTEWPSADAGDRTIALYAT